MESTGFDDGHQILLMRKSMVLMLLLFLSLSGIHDVHGDFFSFNGFMSTEALYEVPNSQIPSYSGWVYNASGSYFYLDTSQADSAGRIIYPRQIQMRDLVNNFAVKSFSTTFIYQIFIPEVFPDNGSGIAFIMVQDNSTTGAPQDYMGLITMDPTSDAYTLGVELDTYMNPEFNDPNANHFGLDLGSMNSTYTLEPKAGFTLTTKNENIFQQVWIDYLEGDSRIDIYYATYGQGKPDTPQGIWKPVDLSLTLQENMYVGFSAAIGIKGANVHKLLAWSFSNEGNASEIWIAGNAPPPGSTPPPPAPPKAAPAPPPTSYGLVATPYPPPGAPVPVLPQPPPLTINISLSPKNAPSQPPPPPSNPSPPSPLMPVPSPDPSTVPPSPPNPKRKSMLILGLVLAGGISILAICIWIIYQVLSQPIHFFLAHAAEKDNTPGSTKDFAERLYNELKSTWRFRCNFIKVFFDKRCLPKGQPFPENIKQALDKTQVGVVIVNEDFFKRKWPMTELLSFVKSMENNPTGVRILPLFYKLEVGDVRAKLRQGFWDDIWRHMSTESHPVEVEECRAAVNQLCDVNGIEYSYRAGGHDFEYINRILGDVGRMCDEMRTQRRGCKLMAFI